MMTVTTGSNRRVQPEIPVWKQTMLRIANPETTPARGKKIEMARPPAMAFPWAITMEPGGKKYFNNRSKSALICETKGH